LSPKSLKLIFSLLFLSICLGIGCVRYDECECCKNKYSTYRNPVKVVKEKPRFKTIRKLNGLITYSSRNSKDDNGHVIRHSTVIDVKYRDEVPDHWEIWIENLDHGIDDDWWTQTGLVSLQKPKDARWWKPDDVEARWNGKGSFSVGFYLPKGMQHNSFIHNIRIYVRPANTNADWFVLNYWCGINKGNTIVSLKDDLDLSSLPFKKNTGEGRQDNLTQF
jgi:hypothetical protein